MRGRRVEIEVVLLHVLAVIPLAAREPEQALLENRVVAVPESHRQAEPSVVVGDPADSVLAPPVRPRPGVIVGEGVPGGAVGAVVFAHRPPLAFGQVGPPPFPVGCTILGLAEPQLFPGHGLSCAHRSNTSRGSSDATRKATAGPAHGERRERPWTGAIWRWRPRPGARRGARVPGARESRPSAG